MFSVTATQLNLRSTPEAKADLSNLIATLPNGQLVEKISDAGGGWFRVSTNLQGTEFAGFVASRYLAEVAQPPVINHISEVHLSKTNANSKRSSKAGLAFPLGESPLPGRDLTDTTSQIQSINAILNWLDVENSIRYKPGNGATYCNIYAFDYCYLCGVYMPRVWWTQPAIIRLSAGQQVPVQYGDTVTEKNANSLLEWFKQWGSNFGWERVNTMTALQEHANNGKVCVLVAKRKDTNRSGHIVAVVPETATQRAKRDTNGAVTVPLQSQAGASNKKYLCSSKWWLSHENNAPKFSEFVLFYHD